MPLEQELKEQLREHNERLRKLEDFILSKMDTILDLAKDLKERVGALEDKDSEFIHLVNHNCTIKDKEIQKAREEAIDISTSHADTIHSQTMKILAGMFMLFIGAVVYFQVQVQDRAVASQHNRTSIDNISHSLDKIEVKLDVLTSTISNHKIIDERRDAK